LLFVFHDVFEPTHHPLSGARMLKMSVGGCIQIDGMNIYCLRRSVSAGPTYSADLLVELPHVFQDGTRELPYRPRRQE
jgi:hypothetical protein